MFNLINGQGTGHAFTTFSSPGTQVAVGIANGIATIDLCGPSDVWYGVGFGTHSMSGAYAIIVYKDSGNVAVAEYTLGNYQRGSPLGTSTITKASESVENGKLCVKVTRAAIDSNAPYDFPNGPFGKFQKKRAVLI